jgi:hypothetical protein
MSHRGLTDALESFNETEKAEIKALLNARPEDRGMILIKSRVDRLFFLDLNDQTSVLRTDPLGEARVLLGTGHSARSDRAKFVLSGYGHQLLLGSSPAGSTGKTLNLQTRGLYMTAYGRQVTEDRWQSFVWGLIRASSKFIVLTIEYSIDKRRSASDNYPALGYVTEVKVDEVAPDKLPAALFTDPMQIANQLGMAISTLHVFRSEQAKRTARADSLVCIEDCLLPLLKQVSE